MFWVIHTWRWPSNGSKTMNNRCENNQSEAARTEQVDVYIRWMQAAIIQSSTSQSKRFVSILRRSEEASVVVEQIFNLQTQELRAEMVYMAMKMSKTNFVTQNWISSESEVLSGFPKMRLLIYKVFFFIPNFFNPSLSQIRLNCKTSFKVASLLFHQRLIVIFRFKMHRRHHENPIKFCFELNMLNLWIFWRPSMVDELSIGMRFKNSLRLRRWWHETKFQKVLIIVLKFLGNSKPVVVYHFVNIWFYFSIFSSFRSRVSHRCPFSLIQILHFIVFLMGQSQLMDAKPWCKLQNQVKFGRPAPSWTTARSIRL